MRFSSYRFDLCRVAWPGKGIAGRCRLNLMEEQGGINTPEARSGGLEVPYRCLNRAKKAGIQGKYREMEGDAENTI